MILFISDLHLDPERPAITQAFYHFLDTTAQGAEALYILGDFFEVWLGDDDDTPLYQDIISRLRHYRDQGHSLYFMHGNRDFLVGQDFAKRTGATLLADPTVIDYSDQRYLLMHGDSLCTKDLEYMQFRSIARSPQWQQQLLEKTLAERRQYAAEVRKKSKTMNSLKADDIMDVTAAEVVNVMAEHDCFTLIHGHTHRPTEHTLSVKGEPSTRWVLGDWGKYGWYLSISPTTTQLTSFDIPSP